MYYLYHVTIAGYGRDTVVVIELSLCSIFTCWTAGSVSVQNVFRQPVSNEVHRWHVPESCFHCCHIVEFMLKTVAIQNSCARTTECAVKYWVFTCKCYAVRSS